MALYVLQPGLQPLGQFDFLDTDASSLVGGLIGTWDEASRTNTSSEHAAADVLDGYVANGVSEGVNTATRAQLRIADSTTSDDSKPFYLLDDGIAGYGTLFGSVINMYNPTGTALGPNTYTASGKVTAWDKPGLYAVSFEACYSNKNITNGALENGEDTPLPGEYLCRYSTGKIGRQAVTTNPTTNKIGVYVEHGGSGSLVTTPARLVGATEAFDRIVFNFCGFDKNV